MPKRPRPPTLKRSTPIGPMIGGPGAPLLTDKGGALAQRVPASWGPGIPGAWAFYSPPNAIDNMGRIHIAPETPGSVAGHEFAHAVNLTQGPMPPGWMLAMFADRAASQLAKDAYGSTEFWTPTEYYPMLGSIYGWNPSIMPHRLARWYGPWFQSYPTEEGEN